MARPTWDLGGATYGGFTVYNSGHFDFRRKITKTKVHLQLQPQVLEETARVPLLFHLSRERQRATFLQLHST